MPYSRFSRSPVSRTGVNEVGGSGKKDAIAIFNDTSSPTNREFVLNTKKRQHAALRRHISVVSISVACSKQQRGAGEAKRHTPTTHALSAARSWRSHMAYSYHTRSERSHFIKKSAGRGLVLRNRNKITKKLCVRDVGS